MDQLVNLLFSAVTKWLFGNMIQWLISLYDTVISLLQATFFDHSFVSGLFTFFEVIGGIMLGIGLIKHLAADAERRMHGESTAFGVQLFSVLKAYGFLILCRPVVLSAHEAVVYVAEVITSDLRADTVQLSQIDTSAFITSVLEIIIIIIGIVSTFSMIFTILRQYAVIVVQVFTGYLYVFDIADGNSGAIGEWGREIIGARLSFGLQLVFYKFGIMELANSLIVGSGDRLFLAGVFLLGASTVPTLLRRWGYANQTGSGALGRFASTAAMMIPRVVG